MDAQEIFDTVARHLLKQRERSGSKANCRYRCQSGLKCAVGILIPDDVYEATMENNAVSGLLLYWSNKFSHLRPYEILLQKLQSIHDSCEVDDWMGQLYSVAKNFNLSTDTLKTLHSNVVVEM